MDIINLTNLSVIIFVMMQIAEICNMSIIGVVINTILITYGLLIIVGILIVAGVLIFEILVSEGIVKDTNKNMFKTVLISMVCIPIFGVAVFFPSLGGGLNNSEGTRKSPNSHYRKTRKSPKSHYRKGTWVNGKTPYYRSGTWVSK